MWRLTDSLVIAWQAVTRQTFRSALAAAGIGLGTLAIVSVVSVEKSWQRTVEKSFAGARLDTLEVTIPEIGNPRAVALARTQLIDDDARVIRRRCPSVDRLVVYSVTLGTCRAGHYTSRPLVYAMGSRFDDIFGLCASAGRFPTEEELARGVEVCVITPALRDKLSVNIGQQLRLEGVSLHVIGVAPHHDDDPAKPTIGAIYIPRRLYRRIFHGRPQTMIRARARDAEVATAEVEAVMSQRVGGSGDIRFVQSSWLARRTALSIRRRVQVVGFLAALCTLFLAGYGLGAFLNSSVAESAQEIGIRRALGGSKTRIVLEIILAGLIIGTAGAGIGGLLSHLGMVFAASTGTPTPEGLREILLQRGGFVASVPPVISSRFVVTISGQTVAVAIGFSLVTCMVASLMPALAAANLDPARAVSVGIGEDRQLRLWLSVLQVGLAVAVLSLLPSLYESLAAKDRSDLRQAFRSDRIEVAVYDPAKLGSIELPPVWQRTLGAFVRELSSPALPGNLRQACPLLSSVEPDISLFLVTVKAGRNVREGAIAHFVRPSYYPKETGPTGSSRGPGQIIRGEFFTEEMIRERARVCVLDTEATHNLFPRGGGIGEVVRVNGVPLTVIGTMSGGDVNTDQASVNACVFIPISLHDECLPVFMGKGGEGLRSAMFSTLLARTVDERLLPRAAQQLRRALLQQMPGGLGGKLFLSEPTYSSLGEYFALRGPAGKRSAFCAAALLLVALIGLVNVLLVSLYRQAREVSIRRALGATKPQVMVPLLAEGTALAAAGAVLGVLVAWSVARGLRSIVAGQEFLYLSSFWALAAATAMLLTGLVASLVPAVLATRVSPATALRCE